MEEKYHRDDLIQYLTAWAINFKNNTKLITSTVNLEKNNSKKFGLDFENLIRDQRQDFKLDYIKSYISDPCYISDSHNGDFELQLTNYRVKLDFKISIYLSKCGGIGTTSLNNFIGWYVCCASDLSKICLIDADYFRKCLFDNKVTTSSIDNYYLYKDYECILEEGKKLNAVIVV